MNTNSFLPIGTIVKANGNSNLLMITGYLMYNYNDGIEKYDYSVCEYPYGILFSNNVKGINHSDIVEVIYEGYRNNNSEEFINELNGNKDIQDVKKVVPKLNISFDENGIVVTDANEKKLEDEEYLSMIDNSPVTNPFINETSDSEEINIVPEEAKEWSIFKNIKFDAQGNVIEAEEYSKDEPKESTIEFDNQGNVVSDENKMEETNAISSNIKFDEFGNVISDDEDVELTAVNPIDIKFDENGNVIEDGSNTEVKDINPVNIKFDELGNVVSDNGEEPVKEAQVHNNEQPEEMLMFDEELF